MFGYIKPFKPELKVAEFDTFQAVYCGLCKELSHVFGPFASLTLSYDFTFVATLSIALTNQAAEFAPCRCVANPLKKKACLLPCDDLQLSASAAMLMMYYKVKDDIADSGFFGKLRGYTLLPFAAHARKKAMMLYGDLDEILAKAIMGQKQIEDAHSKSIDRAADPTAAALGKIFERMTENDRAKIILNRLGYLIGRYVYFSDALDDLESDLKKGGYNPFLMKFEGEEKSLDFIKEYATGVLNITVGEIPPAYELLTLHRYKPILDNIIYLGLHHEMKVILQGHEQKRKKR